MFRSNLISREHEIKGYSLINFEAATVNELPETDWIFFTSKNAAKYFFKHNFNVENIKIACVGQGTYKEVAKYTTDVSFIGDAVNIEQVGKQFATLVGTEKVVFPISNISKRTVQKQFSDPSKIVDLVVYNTQEQDDFEDPKAEVLIFTSPSNARAYFNKLSWQPHQKVIVMGPTTAKQLIELGVTDFLTPTLTGEIGLIDLL